MIKITENAKKFVADNAPADQAPAVVISEVTYRSWCGEKTVISVEAKNLKSIEANANFVNITPQGETMPIFIQKAVSNKLNQGTIDLIGWSYYQRLALLE